MRRGGLLPAERERRPVEGGLASILPNYHVHTEHSYCCEDITVERIAEFAAAWPYPLAITDHSAHVVLPPDMRGRFDSDAAPGVLSEGGAAARDRVLHYLDTLRSCCGGTVLFGIELDVLPDGRPVYPEDLLPELDVVMGAVHALATVRHEAPLHAIRNEWRQQNLALMQAGSHAIAHPFRYLVQHRLPVAEEDVEWLVREAAGRRVALELNSHYLCMDLDDLMVRLCIEEGVRLAIGTDAHRWKEIADFRYHEEVLLRHGLDAAGRRADVLLRV